MNEFEQAVSIAIRIAIVALQSVSMRSNSAHKIILKQDGK